FLYFITESPFAQHATRCQAPCGMLSKRTLSSIWLFSFCFHVEAVGAFKLSAKSAVCSIGHVSAVNEGFSHLASYIIVMLNRRRFHQVSARAFQCAADAAIKGEFDHTHSIDDNASRVRGVPDFQFQLDVEWHITECATFQA